MAKTFTTFTSRKDALLTGFRADDNTALLNEICTNSATSYVKAGFNCTLVPNHLASMVVQHLEARGWDKA